MSHQSDLIATDIDAYLEQHRTKELLRLLTCGSVDDGKSTLIGRLLHDTQLLYEDQLSAVRADSKKHGTTGEEVDLALVVDGLKAEREQGITIDVAYRYFSTARRKFIIADCPGHEQYTRNMATGASNCNLAIILIDARHGVLTQTRRHSFVVSLLGIKHVIVAINKMDLVDYEQRVFSDIVSEYRAFVSKLDITDLHFIPISARYGDNVAQKSERMPWYEGSTLMHMLETVHVASDTNLIDFRLPVQTVLRPNLDFRGFAGRISSGVVRKGDEVMVLPSGKCSRVAAITTYDGDLPEAFAPMSVVVTLEDEIDVSRGDMLARPNNLPQTTTELEATVVWMAETPLAVGARYLLKHSSRVVTAEVVELVHAIDVNTSHKVDQSTLELNHIGRCRLRTTQPVFLDPYARNRRGGAFVLIDRMSNATVAAGMVLDRPGAPSSHWDTPPVDTVVAGASTVSMDERSRKLGHQPATVLLTGLTAAGKSTIARAVERQLFEAGIMTAVLDGQTIRSGLSKDLGFGDPDRSENLRRAAEVAKLMNDAGLLVVAAFVAPNEAVRQRVAEVVGSERFLVVHVDCPLELCRQRDAQGMYEGADRGEIGNFPGVSAPYEKPSNPDLVLRTHELSPAGCAEQVAELLAQRGIVP